MNVIGIAGKAGSGKKTVAGILAGLLLEQGQIVTLDAFGVGVKAEARRRGWNGLKDDPGREFLQQLGAEMRGRNNNYWIQSLVWRMLAGNQAIADYIVVPDVQFKTEAEFCRSSGVLWFVTGRGGLPGTAGRDASEMEVDEIERLPTDTEIVNNGALDELVALVKLAVRDGRHERTASAE